MIQLHPGPAPYDDTHYLWLEGLEGISSGEKVKSCLGEAVTVGRSRHATFSLKKTTRYLLVEPPDRAALCGSLAWRAVSRRHCRLVYVSPDVVELTDLSRNGTFVDGHRVDRIALQGVRHAVHEIRLGPHGDVLRLSCGSLVLDPAPRR